MAKESRKHDGMDSLLPTKILRKHSGASKNPQPKSHEYTEIHENTCRSFQEANFTSLHKFLPMSRSQNPEEFDNDWDELIGYPVCISGVKQGILRYYGRTKFSTGLWCGVELEEPVGKNDGTVNGVRYFYCKPNHGIFAPVTKVALLPLSDSKRHSITSDQNFYRKEEKLLQSTELNFLSQSSSDPAFQKQNSDSSCQQQSGDINSHFCDKRSYTEINTLNNGNESNNFSTTSKGIETVFALRNSSTLPKDMCYYEKQCNNVQQDEITTAAALCKDHASYMNFPRKVMSEYALNVHRKNLALTQSHSCPHSTTRLTDLDKELSSIQTVPINSSKVLPLYDDVANCKVSTEHLSKNILRSSEFLNLQDDNDDDQLSLDYDESLGILTPSEMKDFTLCAEFPTSYSDTRALDFPSSESFDDVIDLPEDEQVLDTPMQCITATCSNVEKPEVCSAHTTRPSQSSSSMQVLSSADKFFSSISSGTVQEVNLGSNYITCLKENSISSPSTNSEDHQSFDSSVVNKETVLNCNKVNERPKDLPTTDHNEKRSVRNAFSFHTSEHKRSSQVIVGTTRSQSSSKIEIRKRTEDSSKVKKHCDTDSSRDSLLHEQEHIQSKEKQLTVSWEDCVVQTADEEAFSKIERPESVYTVGSNDTGYQEDGEFEADVVMTTSAESSDEYKRFSTVSRDSCVPCDDIDGDKVAESNSTSGYSTGLSDSCCNERRDENDRSRMDDSFQDVVDSCTSDDAQDSVSFKRYNLVSEKPDGFFDMDSLRDSESVSDFHITESNTVLGLDSTCETLCETVTDEETIIQLSDHQISINMESNDTSPTKNNENSERNICDSNQKSKVSSIKLSQENSDKEVQRKNVENNNRNSGSLNNRKEKEAEQSKVEPKSPKRNVMSKIKAVINGSTCRAVNRTKSEVSEQNCNKKPIVPKKSRWEAVTSKIAASLAEEKTKPKVKRDIKSRVDTNLSGVRQICRSPKLDLSSSSDNKGDVSLASSTSSRSRKTDKQRNTARCQESNKTMQIAGLEQTSKSPRHIQGLLSLMAGCAPVCRMSYVIHTPPGPSKTCLSSRSTSPVAASESSTSVSLTSHQSRSKIAIWKGSNSTVASSVPPVQSTDATPNPVIQPTIQTNKLTNKDSLKGAIAGKLRAVCNNTSSSLLSPRGAARTDIASKPPCSNSKTKSAKEQAIGSRPLVAPRPVRPPMWLSKVELTQEIQHLSSLCESRTKELNRLKIESRKVTTGFDALAIVIRYMTSDLKAFQNPSLLADLKAVQEKLNQAKKDLDYYKQEIDKLNAIHVNEMRNLSEKLQSQYQEKTQELIFRQSEEISKLKHQHEAELSSLSAALQASCEQEKLQHAVIVDDLQQELKKQREEMEIFHQHELDDLEESYLDKQKALQADLEKLQKQCEEAKQLSKTMDEALQKDSDSKLQWLTSKRLDLQKEVESLKAVLEIKNNELHSLRKENLEMQKDLEELPLAKERIKMLQARAEDLKALMNEKVRIERQLSNEHQVMKETYEKEAKVNKRLSMENEELLWRLKQVAETSLMTVPIPDEEPTDHLPELSPSCPPVLSEEEFSPTSPVKSPQPVSKSRQVFFTYMNQDEMNAMSPHSPRTCYKRIQPGLATHKTASPAKEHRSSRASPRKARASHSLSPRSGGETPPKMPKRTSRAIHDVSNQRQRRSASEEKVKTASVNSTDSNTLVLPDSAVSSASSENSVFEPCLLEEHGNQMCESLKILHEQRTSDFIMDVSSLSCNLKGEWQLVSEIVENKDTCVDQDTCSELIDPKTYYHMTFPVKDSVPDSEEARKGENTEKSESLSSDECAASEK